MSVPRRQTTVHPRIWAPGSPRVVWFITSVLCGWAAAQFALWAFAIPEVRLSLQLDAAGVRAGEYWRFLTHQLFHANPAHFFVTLLVFFYTGREVEPIIGRLPFAALCVAAGVIGGMADWLALSDGAVFGFSAATAAVLAAYATILPELDQRVVMFRLMPVRFRAKWLIVPVIAFAAVALAIRTAGGVGPAGILAGCLTGWMWARFFGFGNQFWYQRRRTERKERELRFARMDSGDFIASEVDPILEKIAREGMGSLTRAERRLLELGRDKLASIPPDKR